MGLQFKGLGFVGIKVHEIVGSLDLDFEWSCCLGLEIEKGVLVGNIIQSNNGRTKLRQRTNRK